MDALLIVIWVDGSLCFCKGIVLQIWNCENDRLNFLLLFMRYFYVITWLGLNIMIKYAYVFLKMFLSALQIFNRLKEDFLELINNVHKLAKCLPLLLDMSNFSLQKGYIYYVHRAFV